MDVDMKTLDGSHLEMILWCAQISYILIKRSFIKMGIVKMLQILERKG